MKQNETKQRALPQCLHHSKSHVHACKQNSTPSETPYMWTFNISSSIIRIKRLESKLGCMGSSHCTSNYLYPTELRGNFTQQTKYFQNLTKLSLLIRSNKLYLLTICNLIATPKHWRINAILSDGVAKLENSWKKNHNWNCISSNHAM